MLTNSYTGIQNRAIPGNSEGIISFGYKVLVNSSQSAPACGFNVNLTPPAYSNGENSTDDDAVSIYTCTRAGDFGDAPASYGAAEHAVDIDYFSNSVYLGTLVDYEPVNQASLTADSDDMNGIDDEDGVVLPVMILDASVNLPVFVTVSGDEEGFLSVWIDWNGNGDFNDAGEQIAVNIPVKETGTVNLKGVTIPGYAITTAPTFIRFRVGHENMAGTGYCSFGEVEDYQVHIINPYIGIDEKDQSDRIVIYSFENDIYVKDLYGKELTGKMRVFNLIGQRIVKKNLMGGTLNKFSMNVEEGYYLVEVEDDNGTVQGKVFLTR
jgi:hypothetical protein